MPEAGGARKRKLQRVTALAVITYDSSVRVLRHAPVAWLVGFAAIPLLLGCQPAPPAVTGITIFPADGDGTPREIEMARTRVQPPIPLIAVRPGADPRLGALLLNQPRTGEIAVTLARGSQHLLLFTQPFNAAPPAVIALFLDHEDAPALTCLVDGSAAHACNSSHAPMAMGLDGVAVPNHSAASTVRGAFRVSLQQAAFPLPGASVDVTSPWLLRPDNVADAVGVVTIDVEVIS